MISNDSGVYILVSQINENKNEYRVTHLSGEHNITCPTETILHTTALNPDEVKKYFDNAPTFTNELDAKEEAYRLADNMYMDTPSIYTVFIYTSYPQWGNQNVEEK